MFFDLLRRLEKVSSGAAFSMDLRKYIRRGQFSKAWAYNYLDRAVVAGDTRRAQRAATLIQLLENWLNENASGAEKYRDNS
jgi:hypothetical protein